MFHKRQGLILSTPAKALAMRPLIRQYLNLDVTCLQGNDLDICRQIAGRIDDTPEIVRRLRRTLASSLRAANTTIGFANQGTIQPHGHIPFLKVNREVVMLLDLEHDLELYVCSESTNTAYVRQEVKTWQDLNDMAEKIGFPGHGMVLKSLCNGYVEKPEVEVISWEQLHAVFHQLIRSGNVIIAESDMRAFANPTRMKLIEKATELLMKKTVNTCPECQWPGFSCVDSKPGLSCAACGSPTNVTLVKIYRCENCSYSDERYYTQGLNAGTDSCEHCNPV